MFAISVVAARCWAGPLGCGEIQTSLQAGGIASLANPIENCWGGYPVTLRINTLATDAASATDV